MKPLLFLDVDGVINCLGRKRGTYDLVEASDAEGVHACVPLGTRERVRKLAVYFEPVWATAWRGAAHPTFAEHLGLSTESWPWLDWADLKLPNIVRYAGERPWAWVDDDARWELAKLHPAFEELPNSLIVTPNAREGLTDEHVAGLLDFASAYNS